MKNEKSDVENCGCEHHSDVNSPSHHTDGHCPTDSFVNNLIDNLKKEFEEELKEK